MNNAAERILRNLQQVLHTKLRENFDITLVAEGRGYRANEGLHTICTVIAVEDESVTLSIHIVVPEGTIFHKISLEEAGDGRETRKNTYPEEILARYPGIRNLSETPLPINKRGEIIYENVNQIVQAVAGILHTR